VNKLFFALLFLSPFMGHTQIADSSKRQVILQGAVNFRDIGGYATTDGHHVKWNRVYRSAAINSLTDADMQVVASKHIHTVVDLRGTGEAKAAPDRLLSGTDYILCPAGSENTMNMMRSLSGLNSGDSLMIGFYTTTDSFPFKYKPFFNKLMALNDSSALLYHCTAGKDRTGIGTALFLYALGVPKQTIMDDYLASNTYRSAENEKMVKMMVEKMHINEKVASDMAAVKAIYLQATFDAIEKEYGSIDKFLQQELGIGPEQVVALRKKYTE
jgi:protein-tyrosine phosphatase